MLTLPFLRDNTALAVAGLQKKNYPDAQQAVNSILEIDARRRAAQLESDALAAEANQAAKQIGALMQQGKKEEAEALRTKVSEEKARLKVLADAVAAAEQELQAALVQLPNVPSANVPPGKTPEENIVAKEGGTIPTLHEGALPHWDIIKNLGIIDFELGNKITGAGFPVYRGLGALLQRRLIQFFLDQAVAAGYEEIQPPILVNADSGYGTGQLPDKEGQMYHAVVDDLYLIPTAEVPVTNIFRDVILEKAQLPQKLAGYTPCFRREAGSWGAHVRGLNRLHQFDKVEIVQVRLPEESYQALEEMCAHVENLLNALDLPWRKLLLCGGDMSFSSAQTFDYEVWSAAQGRWLEVSSVSNFETFQANRLKLRYRPEEKKTALAHTLNGSAMALPRIVAALLENNQQPDGSILLPKVLNMPILGAQS
jgi:seryl-tRNA synthetase